MPHTIEWSQAYAGRFTAAALDPFLEKANACSRRLVKEAQNGLLPFLTFPYVERLKRTLPQVLSRIQMRRHMLVLGIGGSALGARALQRAFVPEQDGPCYDGPSLWIADNVSPYLFESWLSKLPPEETTVVCISKSGGTIETISQYFLTRQWLRDALGPSWADHFVIITDDERGFLRQEATECGIASLEVPDQLGGRYSALSAVGLLPAAFLGIDWHALLDGAMSVTQALLAQPEALAQHPAFRLACWVNALEAHEYSQLIFFCYMPTWATYGAWFAQLWAESLGKQGKGLQPIPAVGVTDQHSINQMFLDGQRDKGCLFISSDSDTSATTFGDDLPQAWSWLRGKPFASLLQAEALGTRMALGMSGVPLVQLHMADNSPHAAGAFMAFLEATTLFTGWLMGINPLDQPAVELGKRLANARLGAPGLTREHADLAVFLAQSPETQPF